MWFKHLRIYRCLEAVQYDPAHWDGQLQKKVFMPCPTHSPQSVGWVSPMHQRVNESLVYAANGLMLICLRVEKKLLPASVVREQLKSKIQEIENQTGRKVGRNEKQNLKEEIYHTLLSKAFTTNSYYYAFFDTKKHYLILDVSSPNQADFFLSTLRQTLGSLKVEPYQIPQLERTMTTWVKTQVLPSVFQIKEKCVLQDPKLKEGIVRVSQQDLSIAPIQSFLKENYFVSEIALTWAEQIAFVLHTDASFHQLKFLDAVKEMASELFSETEAQRFDASFSIMTGTVNGLMEAFEALLVKAVETID